MGYFFLKVSPQSISKILDFNKDLTMSTVSQQASIAITENCICQILCSCCKHRYATWQVQYVADRNVYNFCHSCINESPTSPRVSGRAVILPHVDLNPAYQNIPVKISHIMDSVTKQVCILQTDNTGCSCCKLARQDLVTVKKTNGMAAKQFCQKCVKLQDSSELTQGTLEMLFRKGIQLGEDLIQKKDSKAIFMNTSITSTRTQLQTVILCMKTKRVNNTGLSSKCILYHLQTNHAAMFTIAA